MCWSNKIHNEIVDGLAQRDYCTFSLSINTINLFLKLAILIFKTYSISYVCILDLSNYIMMMINHLSNSPPCNGIHLLFKPRSNTMDTS